MKIVSFSLEQGNKYFGNIGGTRFFIGARVPFEGGKGLMNVSGNAAQKFNRADFRETYGFWSDFIHPTAMAEGGLYHTLNTYDRARFTFSFLQYAAHVPNGDFVAYFRALLKLPLAAEYFSDLRLENDRIVRITDEGPIVLESDTSTDGLLDYLNPSLREIEDTEIIQAAKLIHWAQHDPAHRQAQVDVGIRHFRAKMVEYAARYGLDGKPDTVCLAIADIRHQGRAKSITILAALQSPDPLKALLDIGEPKYHERLVVIRREINRLLAEGTLGRKKYSVANQDFVDV
ncbi:hypothetical protein GCM10023187_13590 [Nibrella viscosa]|uniref:Uncharacterized protein n=1 Tax=Nibrella viscosa TaxID=1084524 RepID=A0ABP8K4A3_9BACT